MADEINQTGKRIPIPPLNPVRDPGARKYPSKSPARKTTEKRRRPPKDDQSHQVDEYA
jgi:hypothetical protein